MENLIAPQIADPVSVKRLTGATRTRDCRGLQNERCEPESDGCTGWRGYAATPTAWYLDQEMKECDRNPPRISRSDLPQLPFARFGFAALTN
jgi:hypothetical protein